MKKLTPKTLYLLSTACILISIAFKESTPILYYGFLAIGLIAFLWAATSTFRN